MCVFVLCVIEEGDYFVFDILMFVGKRGAESRTFNTPVILWYTMQLAIKLQKSRLVPSGLVHRLKLFNWDAKPARSKICILTYLD